MKRFMVGALMVAAVFVGVTVQKATGRVLEVPNHFISISSALAQATADSSDVVLIKDNGTYTESITMVTDVPVRAKAGFTPTIDPGTSATRAVDFPAFSGSNTILEGITIRGGSSEVVRYRGSGTIKNCTIEAESGDASTGILASGSGEIRDCTVTMVSGGTDIGVDVSGAGTDVVDCAVTVSNGTGVRLSSSTGDLTGGTVTVTTGTGVDMVGGESTVSGCTVDVTDGTSTNIGIKPDGIPSGSGLLIQDCLIHTPGGYGIELFTGACEVSYCTIDDAGTGVVSVYPSATIKHCIATNFGATGFGFNTTSGSPVQYCIAPGTAGYSTSSKGTGSVTEDPYYCDASGGVYTLRVDSYGNPENNPSGKKIGAFGVGCVYGTLARDASFAGSGTLDFLGDATIPSGKTLTLGAGTVLEAPNGDNQSGGSNTSKAELIVSGTLDVNGSVSSPVVFTSSETTPAAGDWYGIRVLTNGKPLIDYAQVEYAVYGVGLTNPASGSIRHSTFLNNQSYDMQFSGVGTSAPDTVTSNTLTVGGGSGIYVTNVCPGLTVSNNTITGTSSSSYGVFLTLSPGSPTITGNTISGFTNGEGIRVASGSETVTQNTISNAKYGIRVNGSSTALIGTTSSSSDNIITGCTNGIRCDGSQASPTVRNNQIYSNTTGIYAARGGLPDCGNASQNGLNSIYSNTTCVSNRNTGPSLNALGNWWGSCSAPTCTVGSVLTGGWLCSQPAAVDRFEIAALDHATGLHLLSAWPNPTASGAAVRFRVEEGFARVGARVFDLSGRLVRDLGTAVYQPGEYTLRWDGRNEAGRNVTAGIYFVRIADDRRLESTTKILVNR